MKRKENANRSLKVGRKQNKAKVLNSAAAKIEKEKEYKRFEEKRPPLTDMLGSLGGSLVCCECNMYRRSMEM
jgi:hypothetical protein